MAPKKNSIKDLERIAKLEQKLQVSLGENGCYDFKQLLDNCLYLCSVLGKLSIVYSHLLGSRFNLSTFRLPLTVVLSKGFESEVVQ